MKVGRRYAAAAEELQRLRNEFSRVRTQRDTWIRRFNKLEAAINHHERDTGGDQFSTDADDRLWAARDRVLRDAARREDQDA